MHDSGFRGCLSRWFRLLCSWWQADRVRVSPREGRLLRLRPPCIVRVAGRYVQVLERTAGETRDGPYVCYACAVDDEPAQLWVSPLGAANVPLVRWNLAGISVHLHADEVEVFG